MKKFTGVVQYDANFDEYFIVFDDQLTKDLGWKVGDTLVWKDNNNGSYTLTKKEAEDLKVYMVETVSTFRHRYAVKAKSLEHAYDTVVMNEAEEFHQTHIDENIISGREVSQEEYLKLFSEDEFCAKWDDATKLKYIHTIDYNE